MRSHLRTVVALVLAGGLLGFFLHHVDLWRVAAEIRRARPPWLALSLATMGANLVIRTWRWQFLLEPLGRTTFANAFRATAVGFAATTILPARAGELVRPYFLARIARDADGITATGAFATVILERLLDTITVLVLLAAYVFLLGRAQRASNPSAFDAVTWAAGLAALVAGVALIVLFVLSGHPDRVGRATLGLQRVLPVRLVGLLAGIAETFARGLAIVRRPSRLLIALVLSFPLWLMICLGTWAMTRAFGLAIPFAGSFLLVAILVLGVAVPTPGAVGGFHEAFRVGATVFFGASNEAAVAGAIVLHLFSIGPSLVLGLLFAAQAELNIAQMRRLADRARAGQAA